LCLACSTESDSSGHTSHTVPPSCQARMHSLRALCPSSPPSLPSGGTRVRTLCPRINMSSNPHTHIGIDRHRQQSSIPGAPIHISCVADYSPPNQNPSSSFPSSLPVYPSPYRSRASLGLQGAAEPCVYRARICCLSARKRALAQAGWAARTVRRYALWRRLTSRRTYTTQTYSVKR
jgi:hypothetical protein